LRPLIAGEPPVATNLAFAVRATVVDRLRILSHHLPIVADIQ
jgi:hypothetical protein